MKNIIKLVMERQGRKVSWTLASLKKNGTPINDRRFKKLRDNTEQPNLKEITDIAVVLGIGFNELLNY